MNKIYTIVVMMFLISVSRLYAQVPKEKSMVPKNNAIDQIEIAKKLVAFRLVYESGVIGETAFFEKDKNRLPLMFNQVDFDSSNSIRKNSFRAPEAGFFQFDVRVEFYVNVLPDISTAELFLNTSAGIVLDKIYFKLMVEPSFVSYHTSQISTCVYLAKGEVVYPSYWGPAYTYASFSGFKIE